MNIKHVDIHNLAECSAQEVFDFIAHHMLTQKARSISRLSGQCMYRGEGGRKCAAGALIPDNFVLSEYENSIGWDEFLRINDGISHRHESLICRLQVIHDGLDPSEWQQALYDITTLHGLNPRTLDGFA